MDNKEIAYMLYEQRISLEKRIDCPDGESLALEEMFYEIQHLGYNYSYLADIDLRTIRDVDLMKILLKYLPKMESIYTKQIFIRKINPRRFPEIVDYAINEFEHFSPSDKMILTGFDEVISKGVTNNEYFDRILRLMEDGDSYATLNFVRRIMSKKRPEMIRPYTQKYCTGVLLPLTFNDFLWFADNDTAKFLEYCSHMTEQDLLSTIGEYDYKENQYKYKISVTIFEYWKKNCTLDFIHKEAQKTIMKRNKINLSS